MDLPQSLKNSIFVRGAILHYAGFEDIDHGKFFVILGVFDDKIAGYSFYQLEYKQECHQGAGTVGITISDVACGLSLP